MPPVTADLREIASAATPDTDDIIEWIVDQLDGPDRAEFLQGLSHRVVAASDSESGVSELQRWIGSWILSIELRADRNFQATDLEANQLLSCGKLGDGVTGAELRQRYR